MRPQVHARWVLLSAAIAVVSGMAPANARFVRGDDARVAPVNVQVLATEHFDVFFRHSARESAEIAARLAERWHGRLVELFDHRLRGRQPLALDSSGRVRETATMADSMSEGRSRGTEALRPIIVLPLAGAVADIDHAVGHELVHAFQSDMTSRDGKQHAAAPLPRLPAWFLEGMAEYVALGPVHAETAMHLRDVARLEKLPAVRDLDAGKYVAERWGHAFWAFVAGRWDDAIIRPLLTEAARCGRVEPAIGSVLGVSEAELSKQWHAAIHKAYMGVLATSTPPPNVGTSVLGPRGSSVTIHVDPALSPDARWVAFLSDHSSVAMDLVVADVQNGRVVRKLTDIEITPHHAGLPFLYSSGAWDAAGRRLAVPRVTAGRAALAIFEWPGGGRQREAVVSGVERIVHPAWAPDGRTVAFTGIVGGLADLFTFTLDTGVLTRLTDDAFADLQPSWSPDGRRIAFATDRFTTDLAALQAGPYRLALLDIASGAISPAPNLPRGQHRNPQWSGDGRALYFVGEPDGMANVFRVTLASAAFEQLTRAATGVVGSTSWTAALSVATAANVAAISVYSSRAYEIHILPLDMAEPLVSQEGPGAPLPPSARKPTAAGSVAIKGGTS